MNSSNQIFSITLRSVFRTLLNISNDAFLPEQLTAKIRNWVLNTLLILTDTSGYTVKFIHFCKSLCFQFQVRGDSHIDFRKKCARMTLAGGGIIANKVLKMLSNFKVHELSFNINSLSCFATNGPSVQVKYQT